jgi:hypothetical protein
MRVTQKVRAIRDGGIVGRNTFQRPKANASNIVDIYLNKA